jgi:membrane protein DedA with SNARE-associated domain
MTPGIRSFVAIPAGIGRVPFVHFILLAAIGCAVFCFGLAAVGWAVGSNYDSVRKYLDYIVILAVVLGLAYLILSRLSRRASDPAR